MHKPLFFAALVGLGLTLLSVGGQDVSGKPLPSYESAGSGPGSYATSVPGYPDCIVDVPGWVGDGWCDDTTGGGIGGYNTEACGWDGGDCCECDCSDGDHPCGVEAPFACKDRYSPCASRCSNGVVGIEGENANGKACCPVGCGQCGGSGCGSAGAALGLGNKECCINGVLSDQKACDAEQAAPCDVDRDVCDPNPCGDNSVCLSLEDILFPYALCTCKDGYEDTGSTGLPGDTTCIPIVDGSECSNGIEGIEGENDDGKACCPVDCGQCGGSGCGSAGAAAGLGNKECCINGVLNNQETCSDAGKAPCKVDEAQPTCSNGVVGYEGSNGNGVACCSLGCTTCGGSGCGTIGSTAGLSNKECCINGVLNNQPTCGDTGEAPCVV